MGATLGGSEPICNDGAVGDGRVPVLLVDDQAPFRNAARAVLGRAAPFVLVGEAASGAEAVEMVDALRPALVLMDINMPEMSGIEAARLITDSHPEVVVVLVSTYQVDDLPPDVRSSGASGYLHKEELSGRVLKRLWQDGGEPGWRTPTRANPGSATGTG